MPTLFFSTAAAVERIGHGFVTRSLPKSEWTHAGHFAAVIWLLRERGRERVTAEIPTLIRAYNESTGVANTDTGGYHETITLASVRAAHAMLLSHPAGTGLQVVTNALLSNELGRSDWLLRYWSRAVLFSVPARRAWLAPDIKALPF